MQLYCHDEKSFLIIILIIIIIIIILIIIIMMITVNMLLTLPLVSTFTLRFEPIKLSNSKILCHLLLLD